jgi:hypothetical protein
LAECLGEYSKVVYLISANLNHLIMNCLNGSLCAHATVIRTSKAGVEHKPTENWLHYIELDKYIMKTTVLLKLGQV